MKALITPEMAYEEVLKNNKCIMTALKQATTMFIEKSIIYNTTITRKILELEGKRLVNLDVSAVAYLVHNKDVISALQESYLDKQRRIMLELLRIMMSLEIECDTDVKEALTKTQQKWLLKLEEVTNEIEIANDLIAILNLLNQTNSCK